MTGGIGGHHSPRMSTDRWLTPRWIVDALGRFDLDPCGAPGHRLAEAVWTPEDGVDGLSRQWSGRVWLNPPYGRESVQWLAKLAVHGQGTALVFARTETSAFFAQIWDRADAVLFLRGRLHFLYPDGTPAVHNSGAPSVLVAYGQDDAAQLRGSGIDGRYIQLR